jgi:hypothetical protein
MLQRIDSKGRLEANIIRVAERVANVGFMAHSTGEGS